MIMDQKTGCPMHDALQNPVDGMEVKARYVVRCEHCWPVFMDMGAFTYTQVQRCDYRKEIDCGSEEEAAVLTEKLAGECCPQCGKSGKLTVTTDLDIYNEDQLLRQMNKLASMAR